ncbi:unnamed protein product [marine sediment metagenome]|uniref:Aminotransferase class I/classII large domain-containing protein n=1 Tax=marine sediment metagenome TaxID=412755 RepID=X1F0X1_9ZZZZ
MLKEISKLVANISPSATFAVVAKARELKNKGIDVISFAAGEPNFNTPQDVKDAALKAMKDNFTKYTAVGGIQELKEAICEKFRRDNNVQYKPSQIIVCNGAKQALNNAFLTICNPDDVVLLPTPAYVSFPEQIKLAGAKPLYVPTKEENNFRVTLEDIKSKYNSNVKVLLLNTPNNPSGSMVRKEELEKIAGFLLEKGIWAITDEIYEKLIYDNNQHISLGSISEAMKEQTIMVNGASKTYAMTGWRIGFAAGPEKIISAMVKLQGHTTSNVNSITQKATIEALIGPQDVVEDMRKEYAMRRKYMVDKLNSIRGISCNSPDGAFYTFPNISGIYGKNYNGKKITCEIDVVNYFLDVANVAIVPGKAFEYPDHIRLTFATSMNNIKKGLERIEDAVNKLKS